MVASQMKAPAGGFLFILGCLVLGMVQLKFISVLQRHHDAMSWATSDGNNILASLASYHQHMLYHDSIRRNGLGGGNRNLEESSSSPNELERKQRLQRELKTWTERADDLEMKMNSFLNYREDPYLATKTPAECAKQSGLTRYCSEKEIADGYCDVDKYRLCEDQFPPKRKNSSGEGGRDNPCVVYDFGMQKEPAFGVILTKPPFQCEVHTFDPSTVTTKQEEDDTGKELRQNPLHHTHTIGAGSKDGDMKFRDYDGRGRWSVYSLPDKVTNPETCGKDGACKYRRFVFQETKWLPVKTLKSIMKMLGHERVDLLKISLVGGEYSVLENMIESGACTKVDQMVVDWHHYDFDLRYGVTSNPIVNMLVKLLKERCGLEQHYVRSANGGWPSPQKRYLDMNLRLRSNVSCFIRTKEVPSTPQVG